MRPGFFLALSDRADGGNDGGGKRLTELADLKETGPDREKQSGAENHHDHGDAPHEVVNGAVDFFHSG